MVRQGVLCLVAVLVLGLALTEARYLPTRGQEDKLLRLRQLLKDLLENDLEPMEHQVGGGGFDPRLYKREAPVYDRSLHYLH